MSEPGPVLPDLQYLFRAAGPCWCNTWPRRCGGSRSAGCAAAVADVLQQVQQIVHHQPIHPTPGHQGISGTTKAIRSDIWCTESIADTPECAFTRNRASNSQAGITTTMHDRPHSAHSPDSNRLQPERPRPPRVRQQVVTGAVPAVPDLTARHGAQQGRHRPLLTQPDPAISHKGSAPRLLA